MANFASRGTGTAPDPRREPVDRFDHLDRVVGAALGPGSELAMQVTVPDGGPFAIGCAQAEAHYRHALPARRIGLNRN
jgi:hypothetical protein